MVNVRRMTNFKRLRMKKALSLSELSQLSNLSPVTINRVENGLQKPRPSTIRSLARGLGIDVEDLTTEDDYSVPSKSRPSSGEPS